MLSAAPLRRLSPQTNRASVSGDSGAWRSRPTKRGSAPRRRWGWGTRARRGRRGRRRRRLDERLARLGHDARPGEHGVDATECDEHRHPHAGGRDRRSGMPRILRVSLRSLSSSVVQPVVDVVPGERQDVERERCRERRLPELLLDEPAHVARPGAQLAVAVRRRRARRAAGHAGAAQAGDRLVRRDDQPGELRASCSGERVDHRHVVELGLAMMPRGRSAPSRVDLGDDQRDVGVHPAAEELSIDHAPAAASSAHSPGVAGGSRTARRRCRRRTRRQASTTTSSPPTAASCRRPGPGGQANRGSSASGGSAARRARPGRRRRWRRRRPGSAARSPRSPPRWQPRQRPVPP